MNIYENVPAFFRCMVPEYKSKVIRPLVARIENYSPRFGDEIAQINPKRMANRIHAYLDPVEVARVRGLLVRKDSVSIRFGFEKKGRGYNGERGDFCMVGGAINGKTISMFYRSLELIGGFGYDLGLLAELSRQLERQFTHLEIYAPKANVFALKRNSNEKLYPKLQRVFGIRK